MKLQTRLILYFSLVALLAVIISAPAYLEVRRLGLALHEIGAVRLPSIEALERIRQGKGALDRSLESLAFHEESAEGAARELASQERSWGEIEKGWSLYQPLPQTPEEAEEWKAFVGGWQAFKINHRILASDIVKSITQNNLEALQKCRERAGKLKAQSEEMDRVLSELIAINSKIILEQRQKSIASLEDLESLQTRALLLTFGCALATLASGFLIARRITRPILDMISALANITSGNLRARVGVKSSDELGTMAKAFNGLAESLENSEARLAGICDNLSDSMVYQFTYGLDGQPRFLHVSKAVERVHGVTAEAVERDGTLLFNQILPEDLPVLLEAEKDAAREMKNMDVTIRIRRPDGEIRWIHLVSTPRRLADGSIVWAGVDSDATKSKGIEEELQRTNRALRAITMCSRVLIQAQTEAELLEEICKTIVEQCGYQQAAVGFPQEDRSIKPAAHFGVGGKYIQQLRVSFEDNELGRGPTGTAFRTGKPSVCQNFQTDLRLAPWRAMAAEYNFHSAVGLPLKGESGPFAVLTIYASQTDAFNDQELELLVQLADDLAYGIQSLRNRLRNRQSEKNLHTLFEGIADGILVAGLENQRLLAVNSAACAMLGYKREELLGLAIRDIHPQESLALVQAEFQRMVAGDSDLATHIPVLRRDGSVFFANIRSTVIELDGQQCLVGVFRDITADKSDRDALLASESRLAGVTRLLGEWVWETNADGLFTYSSGIVEKLLGYRPEELIGKLRMADFLPDGKSDPARECLEALFSSPKPIERVELLLARKTGEPVNVHFAGEPLLGGDGRPVGYRGSLLDITQQKQTELQLRKLSHAVEQSPLSIVITDLDGRIEYVNATFTQITGYTSEEILGKNPRALKSGELTPADYKELWKTITSGGVWNGEFHNRKKNGELFWESAAISPIKDATGRITHFLAVKRDITAEKQLQSQFLRAQRMESIGTLASGVAHDLNNVLGPIMMSLAVLRDLTADNPKIGRILDNMQLSVRHGADIVRQVLSFARGAEGDRIELQPKHLLREILEIIQSTFPKSIAVRADLPADMWTIQGDQTQLHQVFMNLCVNARDAMPDGGILSIGAENVEVKEGEFPNAPELKPGPYVRISVGDTGTGIPEEIQHKIFDPFFTTKEVGKGTGLGLSTVMAIVKGHGGAIELNSNPEQGTLFRIYLPAMRTFCAAERSEKSDAPPRGNGETVLVVDDEPSARLISQEVLETHGYKVLTASDGAEAIATYAQHHANIAAVVMDMMMPVMDGATAIHALRKIDPGLKILAVSGFTPDGLKAKLSLDRVRHFLSKPFTARSLLKKLREVIEDEP